MILLTGLLLMGLGVTVGTMYGSDYRSHYNLCDYAGMAISGVGAVCTCVSFGILIVRHLP